jgi:antitoxin component YwqK of YwqJK toxin-antitoxin module
MTTRSISYVEGANEQPRTKRSRTGREIITYYGLTNIVKKKYTVDGDGLRHGRCNSYFKNGDRRTSVGYTHGSREGQYFRWNSDGVLIVDRTFFKNECHGWYLEWYANGKIKIITAYKNGKTHGTYREWNRNGVLVFETTYKNGKFHGLQRKWYDSGTIASVYTYNNGVLDGDSTLYYKNLQVADETTYRDGYRNGSSKRWRESKCIGDDNPWYAEKQIALVCTYVYGKFHGEVVFNDQISAWYGTTDETRGMEIGKEAHDAEMASTDFCETDTSIEAVYFREWDARIER